MRITVKLIGPLIYAAGFSEKEVEVPEPTTTDGLLDLIGVDRERPRIVTRNGRAIGPVGRFEEGDRVVVSPLYSGG